MDESRSAKRKRHASNAADEADVPVKKKTLDPQKDIVNQEVKEQFYKLPSLLPSERKEAVKYISSLTVSLCLFRKHCYL